MIEMFEAQWPVLAAAVAVLLLAVWLLVRGRRAAPRERHRAPDALDEGAPPAARNQALIDAPSAVTVAKAVERAAPLSLRLPAIGCFHLARGRQDYCPHLHPMGCRGRSACDLQREFL